MPAFPSTAMSGLVPHPQPVREDPAEPSAGSRFRQTHGDATNWPAHDFEVYYDLARAMLFPDRGPGQTR